MEAFRRLFGQASVVSKGRGGTSQPSSHQSSHDQRYEALRTKKHAMERNRAQRIKQLEMQNEDIEAKLQKFFKPQAKTAATSPEKLQQNPEVVHLLRRRKLIKHEIAQLRQLGFNEEVTLANVDSMKAAAESVQLVKQSVQLSKDLEKSVGDTDDITETMEDVQEMFAETQELLDAVTAPLNLPGMDADSIQDDLLQMVASYNEELEEDGNLPSSLGEDEMSLEAMDFPQLGPSPSFKRGQQTQTLQAIPESPEPVSVLASSPSPSSPSPYRQMQQLFHVNSSD